MSHRTTLAIALFVGMLNSFCAAQDMVPQMLKYFPGKWEITSGGGNPAGQADWRLAAGGKVIAGPGVSQTGAESFAMAGWDANKKEWVHTWYEGDGTHGRITVTQFKDNTYEGTLYYVDKTGAGRTSKWQNKIIDKDNFEVTEFLKDQQLVLRFHRK